MYTLLLLVVTAVSALFLTAPVKHHLIHHAAIGEICAEDWHSYDVGGAETKCERLVGFLGVYRVCLAAAAFFAALAVLTPGVASSLSWRAALHNGFWLLKFAAVAGATFGLFTVPSERFDRVRQSAFLQTPPSALNSRVKECPVQSSCTWPSWGPSYSSSSSSSSSSTCPTTPPTKCYPSSSHLHLFLSK